MRRMPTDKDFEELEKQIDNLPAYVIVYGDAEPTGDFVGQLLIQFVDGSFKALSTWNGTQWDLIVGIK